MGGGLLYHPIRASAATGSPSSQRCAVYPSAVGQTPRMSCANDASEGVSWLHIN
jgi:hypothetical protein